MASETKSVFLYGNPTYVKRQQLSQIQTAYTAKINEFIQVMVTDSAYYLDLLNNNKKSPLIRGLEKSNRGDLGSALGQNAIDHATKELHNYLTRLRNEIYGETIDRDANLFVSYISLFNASIQSCSYEHVLELVDDLIRATQAKVEEYQALKNQLIELGKPTAEQCMQEIKFLFDTCREGWKIPFVKKATVQLDSRLFTLGVSKNVKADFVIEIKKLTSQKVKGEPLRILIPVQTSTNSLRRLNQYKKSNTATFSITEKGQLKVTIPFEKKVKSKSNQNTLRGVDVGITDLMVDSEGQSFGQYASVTQYYNTHVLPEQAKMNNLRNQMRSYQKELKRKSTPASRKVALRKKIFNLNTMLMKNKSLSRALKGYYHRQEIVLSQAVNDYVASVNGTAVTTVLESLDLKEFNRSKAANRRDSMWARGMLTKKLISKLTWQGYDVVSVDPAYTSQMCSTCFYVHEENRRFKTFKCQHCSLELDADHNAAINIKNRALDSALQAIVAKYQHNPKRRHEEIKKHLAFKHQAFITAS